MSRGAWGRGLAAASSAAGVALLALTVRADPKPLAKMSCRVEAGSGRLLCTVSVAAPPGQGIVWSDALVVAAPSAARPLRSRVASTSERPAEVVLAFVLGSGAGGRIAVTSRAVACPLAPRAGACAPFTSEVAVDFEPPG